MRLLHAKDLVFDEFFDDNCPDYAILSHRWFSQKEELTYRDFLDGKKRETKGWAKITATCDKALAHKYDWIWVDTCCIDKTSSAELTEAINSMFRWYQNAKECYVYLYDVTWEEKYDNSSAQSSTTHLSPSTAASSKLTGSPASRQSFRNSDWHTRGWTLQELLAPQNVIFYDKDWRFIGKKEKLAADIAAATGIRLECLFHNWALSAACIAERMSWAATRKCSRVEDMAYSLLGIFNVNMPLLYGEGKKAFLRLQEEIVKKSDDESIFAWCSKIPDFGLLAPAAAAFKESGDIRSWAWEDDEVRRPYAMTNKGLEVHLPASSVANIRDLSLFKKARSRTSNHNNNNNQNNNGTNNHPLEDVKLPLNCSRRIDQTEQRVSLTLSKTSGGWRRIQCDVLTLSVPPSSSTNGSAPPSKNTAMVVSLGSSPSSTSSHTIYVRQDHTRTNGAPSASASTDGLPGGWEMRHTPTGRAYFVDHASRTTSWVHPAGIGMGGERRWERGPVYTSSVALAGGRENGGDVNMSM
jgi:hypothetical protein